MGPVRCSLARAARSVLGQELVMWGSDGVSSFGDLGPSKYRDIRVTDKRFHSNLAKAPTCDTVSTYHITLTTREIRSAA